MFCWVPGNRTKQDANCYYRKNDWPQWASSFLRHPNRFCLWSMWMIHPYVSGEQMCFCQKKTLIVLSSTALKFFQSLLEVFQLFSSAFTKSVRGRKFNKEKTILRGEFLDDDKHIIAHNEVFEAPLESSNDVIWSLASSLRMKGKSIRLGKGTIP